MPFRRIFLEAKRSLSLIEPHPGQTHVRSRNNRPLLIQPHSQVLEEGYHLSILCTITPYFEAIYVMMHGDREDNPIPEMLPNAGTNPDNIITTISGIGNDGGDW